ncbi:HK97 family phage prohead protease [Sphingomonas sp. CD22]|uniref:HK97 family phage prohead protease n=1 Tax=Sphingomonas sp. CD22 TaxID=3100214 RepID=UPI002AE01712|nr:HK97 family phage prohead protease [Sphingomonas sp. CD22]MEA1085338.1 HK97 family phage prohead protease [Sphingomonas sp. CD22]
MAGVTAPVRFAGYAALFDRADRAGDVMRPGAFADAGAVPLLWQHRGRPVGRIVGIGEDARGLRIAGEVDDPRVAALVRGHAIDGLSVGYRPLSVAQGARRELLRVALVEVSLVAVPMQPGARIDRID